MLVRAPGSTANLGPGFDCLALALDLPFWLSVGATDLPDGTNPTRAGLGNTAQGAATPTGMMVAEPTHPASVAFVEAGGDPSEVLHWRSPIPPGRGLGYSGAARVAGAFAARRLAGDEPRAAREAAFDVAMRLEGHGDNAAASIHGGFVVVAGDLVTPVEVPEELCVLAWSPHSETSTDTSRASLPGTVDLADAAFSIARAALWVVAISQGRPELVAESSKDRVHQPFRLPRGSDSARMLDAFAASDAVFGAWLSGSGPTVAALARTAFAPELAEDLGSGSPAGVLRVVDIDREGTVEIRPN